MTNSKKVAFLLISTPVYLLLALLLSASPVFARDITFPVIGSASYSNDYYAQRASGPHHATDIIGKKHQRLVAVVSGTITDVQHPEPYWGYSVTIRDDAGYRYRYIHMNNDTPGTDNGAGGGMNAYAPDIREGNRVVKGQHIGYIGDSGNAENTVSHVHFEMFKPDGGVTNPYSSLLAQKS